MRLTFLIICFAVQFVFAQNSSKGTISLKFNDEMINLPLSNASIQKEKGIVLNFNAQHIDSSIQLNVSISIGLRELSSEPNAETLEGMKIEIYSRDIKNNSGKDLFIRFDDNKPESSQYSIYNSEEKSSWKINTLSMKVDITSVEYTNNKLHIIGVFDGKFKSTSAPEDQVSTIDDGKFEIII